MAALLTLCLAAQTSRAGPSKAECVAAHETGQRMLKAEKLRKALRYLNQCAVDECPALLSKECAAWRDAVSADLPTVSVRAIVSDGTSVEMRTVLIDGELVESFDSHAVDPGQHTVIVTSGDGRLGSTLFAAKRGARGIPVVVQIPGPPPIARPPSASAAQPPAFQQPPKKVIEYVPVGTRIAPSAAPYAWGFAATGVAALATFAWFGLAGRSKERDMDRDCAPFCAQSELDAMHRDYVVADISLGIGVAALGATVWIIHAYREQDRPAAPAPQAAGFDLRGMRLVF